MDLDLVGYLFDLLDPQERERTEAALRADAEARCRLERLRVNLAPLAAVRDSVQARAGLADRTLERLAPYLRDHRPTPARRLMPAGSEPVFAPSRWRRMDAVVAACILIVVGGLAFSGVGKVQQKAERIACQNNMRQLHQAFVSYGAMHDGRFPQITDQPPTNVARAFVPMLVEAGQLSQSGVSPCPTTIVVTTATPDGGYAYSLGFRGPDGRLYGLGRGTGQDSDLLPALSDRWRPAGHASGHNVLFVGGNVRFSTTPKVGVNGDDIFLNQAQTIAAGLHRMDTVLADGNTPP